MTKIIAVNDLKLKCGNLTFKECRVVFRDKSIIIPNLQNKLLISELIKPSLIKHKDGFICYCNGIIEQTIVDTVEEEDEYPYHEDPNIEDPFCDYSLVEKMDLVEEIEQTYQKEKVSWIKRFSKNENSIEAITLEYECDDQYCQERMDSEYPGFMIIDHTTRFFRSRYPSMKAMSVEKRLMTQVNGSRAKYGTYIRIVELDLHQQQCYGDQEAIVIFNYLNKFEIIGLVSVVGETVYGRQLECSNLGSEVLSN